MSKPKPASERVRFEVIASPKLIDEFFNQKTYECVRVWWKGEHFLSIKKVLDSKTIDPTANPDSERRFDDDDDDDDDNPLNGLPTVQQTVEYIIHCEWPLYKVFHGTFQTLDLAKEQAIKSTEEMELFIRQKFTRPSPTGR